MKRPPDPFISCLVRESRDASAQAVVQGFEIPLPCVPEIIAAQGRVAVKQRWLVTGAHIAVVLGLLELFVDGLIDALARCPFEGCQKFYIKTPALRVAC